ncbi:amidohydrolase family protein [Opitutus terrae]|uniref:Amidohydrolase-related domain-containing protein n=1 Tax=Opitutus terrae (strain DSM 11246 / JCM 15787 / PB90-1) TaxID=452637 RepID=B1ZXB8_OPITP|nr:hypothetical protein [Opitutus terrae]ACB76170.1 hypothetical protein Oter_2889 [Opitutus terrae PB90-1]
MKYFDANTWIGRWPFSLQPALTARSLAVRLKEHGIGGALVSPVDAVFAPEPTAANRALLRETRTQPMLVPVPVIQPALANWREQLDAVGADARVRAVRLLPNYHGYRLTSARLDVLFEELAARGLRVIVTIRLIDERHEYFALKIHGVPVRDLDALLRRHPERPVLASGLLRTEMKTLVPKHRNLLADLTFAEWYETLRDLRRTLPAAQIAFASHTPFLIMAAAKAKLQDTGLPRAELSRIAAGSLEKFLRS